jgi:hypothetical protein
MDRYAPPLAALVLALLAINSADVLHKWWHGAGPAIEWHGVKILTEVVQPGGQIEMIYSATIHRQCPSEIRGFVMAPDGTVPVRFPVVAGGYTEPSEEPVQIRVSITMPLRADPGLSPLRSGNHIYRTMVTRYCPAGVETDNAVPDIPFTLQVPP